jgi:hypothetical protein
MNRDERARLKQGVRQAFLKTHAGRSTDDVVIDDDLNRRFLAACQEELPSTSPEVLNWTLFTLRKASGLGPVTSTRERQHHDDYMHAAEIAARLMEDKYELTIDRVLCDPRVRTEFDTVAQYIAPDVPPYRLRKAALKLRKGRQLRPEKAKRIVDWSPSVLVYTAAELCRGFTLVPRQPGVYFFRDRTGYLYIGEADDLRVRVAKHLDHSERKALARYLWDHGIEELSVEVHAFSPTSGGGRKTCRRVCESEMIASRRPRFNIQP